MAQELFPQAFFDAPSAPNAQRRAALTVHAMAPEDQRWLLDQLPSAQAEVIQALLKELRELGVPSDRALLGEVVSQAATSAAMDLDQTLGRSKELEPSLVHDLERADPAQLIRVLEGEPAGLIAHLLEIRDWPWAESILSSMEMSLRDEVESRRIEASRAPYREGWKSSLNLHLMKGLSSRLARLHASTSLEPDSPGVDSGRAERWRSRMTFSALKKAGAGMVGQILDRSKR